MIFFPPLFLFLFFFHKQVLFVGFLFFFILFTSKDYEHLLTKKKLKTKKEERIALWYVCMSNYKELQ